jgi:hypothetical protein
MISQANFEKAHLEELHRRYPLLTAEVLEMTLYAFCLLQALADSGLPFIFKGGTSLLLLLKEPQRISTDVDILCDPKEPVEIVIIGGASIAWEEVQTAVKNLYDGWANLPSGAEDFLRAVMANQDYRVLYEKSQREEDANHALLKRAAKEDPGKFRQKTLEEVSRLLKKKEK